LSFNFIPTLGIELSSLLPTCHPIPPYVARNRTDMAEIDTHSTTPPIELGTPWKSASHNGKATEPLPPSPGQTHVATRSRAQRSPATQPRESAERLTPDYKRSSGGSQQEGVERDRVTNSVSGERNGGASNNTSGEELPVGSGRRYSAPHDDQRVGVGRTPSPPAPQQAPFPPPRPSSTGASTGTAAQRRNLSAVSAISCSMCSATGVNSLWRRDRAGKPICGKCCEQLRRRLNPRYVSPCLWSSPIFAGELILPLFHGIT
jgi:hypothetical protein